MLGEGTLQHSVHLLGIVLMVYRGRAVASPPATGTKARKQKKFAATLSGRNKVEGQPG
jgi:hypothetical protein